MRKRLCEINGTRMRFTATVECFGWKNGYYKLERTIILTDVRLENTNEMVTDHLWYTCGETFTQLSLSPGDRIAFDARVTRYTKGYQGRLAEERGEAWITTDCRLERPTKAVKLIDANTGWLEPGFTSCEAKAWHEAGFNPDKAKAWRACGFSVLAAVFWRDCGFLPLEARVYVNECL